MGGIKTDLAGRSTIQGLYAAGETACTGVHGANRLASNSLLEGLVFRARVAHAMRDEGQLRPNRPHAFLEQSTEATNASEITQRLRQSMWQCAGVIRDRGGLLQLQNSIAEWKRSLKHACTKTSIETRNLLTVAKLIARSALAREESRGAHFRSDFPAHDNDGFQKHSVVVGDQIRFE